MATSVPRAITFFGVIQIMYTIFSASTKRWNILLQNITNLTLKLPSTTRWEIRIESVKSIRFQLSQVYNAFLEINDSTKDPKIKSEAISLANNEFTYEFVLSVIIWYELLFSINKISKSLQNESINLSNAVEFMNGIHKYLSFTRYLKYNL